MLNSIGGNIWLNAQGEMDNKRLQPEGKESLSLSAITKRGVLEELHKTEGRNYMSSSYHVLKCANCIILFKLSPNTLWIILSWSLPIDEENKAYKSLLTHL